MTPGRRPAGWSGCAGASPTRDAVVFGHSHIPLHEERDGFQIFNPGSPTDRRRQPQHTMGLATIEDGTSDLRADRP